MFRHRSTTASGEAFDEAIIEAVWEKAQVSEQHHPLRLDAFGMLIWKEAYGNTSSKLGWEIDHIKAVAEGGGDEFENLQALQWENNRRKDNGSVKGEPKLKLLPRPHDLRELTSP